MAKIKKIRLRIKNFDISKTTTIASEGTVSVGHEIHRSAIPARATLGFATESDPPVTIHFAAFL